MPKLVYNLLSVQELKRRLKECHLPLQGSRDQLIKRHQDFVYLYNAQCDSLNPKSGERICSVFFLLKWKNKTRTLNYCDITVFCYTTKEVDCIGYCPTSTWKSEVFVVYSNSHTWMWNEKSHIIKGARCSVVYKTEEQSCNSSQLCTCCPY